MANSLLRKEVLKAFKSLHRTRQYVFEGDGRALSAARQKINEEYRKYMDIQEEETIRERIEFSKSVEEELKTTVVQAREKAPGTGKFVLRITPETTKLDNFPFDPNVEIPRAKRRELAKACCQVKIDA